MIGIEWAPLAGATVGLIIGLTGVGGGALMAPILFFGFGFDLVTVIATDLLFATCTKLIATRQHQQNHYVDWQVAKQLWKGSIPATLLTIILAHQGVLFADPAWITALLGILVLLSGLSLFFENSIGLRQKKSQALRPAIHEASKKATIVSGFLLGGFVSTTSIGAGALGALIFRTLSYRMQPNSSPPIQFMLSPYPF